MVKKKSGIWRVCVDFTNLNKACPKDPFPVLRIDQLVDEFPGNFSGVSPEPVGTAKSGENGLPHPNKKLSLPSNAFWPKECWIYISENGD